MIPCVIPARGGSKGIPGKNMVPVGGKPLIVWSIEHAQQAQCVGTVCVATDCEPIANIAEQHDAKVFWRSAESASDNAPTEQVLTEIVSMWFPNAAVILFLQATSPIRQPYDIDRAYHRFMASGADSLFSACQVHGYTWMRTPDRLQAEYATRQPRQQVGYQRLEENGSLYLFRPDVLLQTGQRLGGRIVEYEMHPLDSFQIDEPEDIPLIENLMTLRNDHSYTTHTI